MTFWYLEKGIYGRTGRRRLSVIKEDVRRIMDYYHEHYDFPEVILATKNLIIKEDFGYSPDKNYCAITSKL